MQAHCLGKRKHLGYAGSAMAAIIDIITEYWGELK